MSQKNLAALFAHRLLDRFTQLLKGLARTGLLLGLCTTGVAHASPGLDALDHFFTKVDTFAATFKQEVLDESMEAIDFGEGTMMIERPGLFRWDYQPPDEQLIVGDGERVWIHDVELEQITVRNQQRALGRTPAILLAGTHDIQENYDVIDAGRQGSYDWVNLIPLGRDTGFTEIRIGFEDNRLRIMEMLDNLGQRTRISFLDRVENQPISDEVFEFTPPEGVDVIDESGEW